MKCSNKNESDVKNLLSVLNSVDGDHYKILEVMPLVHILSEAIIIT